MLFCCVFILGTAMAQETEFERPPSPPPPSIEKRPDPAPPPPAPIVRGPETNPDSPSYVVEFPYVDSEFPGGPEAMKKFIQDNVNYPEEDIKTNTQGRVYVKFIVEKDGSISDISFMRGGVSPTLNREAARLIESMPPWIPAEDKNGEKVRSRCRLPITFTLSSGEDEEEVPKEKRLIKQ